MSSLPTGLTNRPEPHPQVRLYLPLRIQDLHPHTPLTPLLPRAPRAALPYRQVPSGRQKPQSAQQRAPAKVQALGGTHLTQPPPQKAQTLTGNLPGGSHCPRP